MTEQTQIYPLEEKFRPVTIDTDDAIEFLNEINIYNDRYSGGEWIFRGQNNANWCLVPSIFRDKQVLKIAEKEIDSFIKQNPNEAMVGELTKRNSVYKFLLARICAAVEQDRVNAFVIRLDNADIRISYHSNFHHPEYSPELNFNFLLRRSGE